MELSKDAQRRLNERLNEISAAMRLAGKTEDEITLVLDALREQVSDMSMSCSEPISEQTINEIIADFGGPESYALGSDIGLESVSSATQKDNKPVAKVGRVALFSAIAGVPLALVGGVIAGVTVGGGMEFGSFLLFVSEIAAFVFGAVSRAEHDGKIAVKIAAGVIIGYFALIGIAFVLGE